MFRHRRRGLNPAMVSTFSHLQALVLTEVMSLCRHADTLPLALQGFLPFPILVGSTSAITQFSRQERPLSVEGLEWVQAQFPTSRPTGRFRKPFPGLPCPAAALAVPSRALQGFENQNPVTILVL